MKEAIYQYLTCAAVLLLLGLVLIEMNQDKRIVKLEQVCHGQCLYGDAACVKHCSEEGHCPTNR